MNPSLQQRVDWKRALRYAQHGAIVYISLYALILPAEAGIGSVEQFVCGPLAKSAAAFLLAVTALRAAGKINTIAAGRLALGTSIALYILCFALVTNALAAGSGMPWEEPLQQVLESVQGPVAKIVAVIIIIATGLTLAFGETAGGFRRLIQIVFGLSIAFAASSFFLSFFSFGGGALIA